MPRGRFMNKSVSTSPVVGRLYEKSIFAGILFERMIPHADRYGCVDGPAQRIVWTCAANIPDFPAGQADDFIQYMVEVGLAERVTSKDGLTGVHLINFEDNQPGYRPRKEAPSKYEPAGWLDEIDPPNGAGKEQVGSRSGAGRDLGPVKREGKGKGKEVNPPNPPAGGNSSSDEEEEFFMTDDERDAAKKVIECWNFHFESRRTAAAHEAAIVRRMREHPELTVNDHCQIIHAHSLQMDKWWEPKAPSPRHVYGTKKAINKAIELWDQYGASLISHAEAADAAQPFVEAHEDRVKRQLEEPQKPLPLDFDPSSWKIPPAKGMTP